MYGHVQPSLTQTLLIIMTPPTPHLHIHEITRAPSLE